MPRLSEDLALFDQPPATTGLWQEAALPGPDSDLAVSLPQQPLYAPPPRYKGQGHVPTTMDAYAPTHFWTPLSPATSNASTEACAPGELYFSDYLHAREAGSPHSGNGIQQHQQHQQPADVNPHTRQSHTGSSSSGSVCSTPAATNSHLPASSHPAYPHNFYPPQINAPAPWSAAAQPSPSTPYYAHPHHQAGRRPDCMLDHMAPLMTQLIADPSMVPGPDGATGDSIDC